MNFWRPAFQGDASWPQAGLQPGSRPTGLTGYSLSAAHMRRLRRLTMCSATSWQLPYTRLIRRPGHRWPELPQGLDTACCYFPVTRIMQPCAQALIKSCVALAAHRPVGPPTYASTSVRRRSAPPSAGRLSPALSLLPLIPGHARSAAGSGMHRDFWLIAAATSAEKRLGKTPRWRRDFSDLRAYRLPSCHRAYVASRPPFAHPSATTGAG